MFYSVAPTRT